MLWETGIGIDVYHACMCSEVIFGFNVCFHSPHVMSNAFVNILSLLLSNFYCAPLFYFSAGDLRSIHTLSLACAKSCVPPGSGSANSLQFACGQDQSGLRLSGGSPC